MSGQCSYILLQIYFDVIAEFLARSPSKVPVLHFLVRHISPPGSDVCLLCPGGEPQTNKYDAEIEFIFHPDDPEAKEFVTMVGSLVVTQNTQNVFE